MGAAQGRGPPPRRARQRALRALPARPRRGPQGLDDPPHGPARRPGGASRCPSASCRCSRASATLPRDDGGWAFEIKWDGVRAICHSEPGRLRLHSRNGLDITARYPELARLNRALSHHRAILDGEVVAFDADGPPELRARCSAACTSPPRAPVRRLARELPVTYVIFDLLWLDGHSLMELPYAERRERLAALGLDGGERWRVPEHVIGHGARLLEATAEQGLEGVVAKRLDSPYEPGRRSPSLDQGQERADRQDVVIGGWMPGEGRRRERIGALLVGVPEDGGLRYAGRVGTGFTEGELDRLEASARARWSGPTRPSRPASPPRRRARSSSSRALRGRGRVPRVDPSGGSCARRPTRACARTSPPGSSCARSPTRAVAEVAGPRGQALEPRQGPLSAGGVHQARRHRLLRRASRPCCSRTSRAAR